MSDTPAEVRRSFEEAVRCPQLEARGRSRRGKFPPIPANLEVSEVVERGSVSQDIHLDDIAGQDSPPIAPPPWPDLPSPARFSGFEHDLGQSQPSQEDAVLSSHVSLRSIPVPTLAVEVPGPPAQAKIPPWTNYLPPSRYSRIGSSGLVTSRLRVSEPQLGGSWAQHQASPPSPFAVLVSKSDPDPNPEPTLNFGENMLQALKVSESSHIGPSTFYGVVFDVLAWNCNGNAKTAKYLKELRKQRSLKVVFLCETRLKRVEKRKQGEALSEDDPGDDASPVLQFGPSTFHVVVLEVWEFGKVDDDPGDDRSSPKSMQQ